MVHMSWENNQIIIVNNISGTFGTPKPSEIQFPKVHKQITRRGFQGGRGNQVSSFGLFFSYYRNLLLISFRKKKVS